MRTEKVETVRLPAEGFQYGDRLALTPGLVSPPIIDIIGRDRLLPSHKIGLLCSIQCPGDIILKTLDLMHELRNLEVCVVSGFHSPLEQECLKILLRGTCAIVVCYARSLPGRVPPEYVKPIDDGRVLLLSPFNEAQNHATRNTSRLRNRLVVALGDAVLVPYAASGGITEGILREVSCLGKPVLTFQADRSGADDNAMLVAGAAALIQSLSRTAGASFDTRRAADSASSKAREPKYRLSDIRRVHSRAYEKWTCEEEARLKKLLDAGRSKREIAQELQRQPSAISRRLRKLGLVKSQEDADRVSRLE